MVVRFAPREGVGLLRHMGYEVGWSGRRDGDMTGTSSEGEGANYGGGE